MRQFKHSLFWIALLILACGNGFTANAADGPITFTVHVIGGSTKTALRLEPGFATVLRADHRVETVAIGDPRLVTATTVKRGQDVYDLVLQPQTATGATNMIVWFGDLTSIWDLTIGPGRRTADIVYVVITPPAAIQSNPSPPVAVPSQTTSAEAAPPTNVPAPPGTAQSKPGAPTPPKASSQPPQAQATNEIEPHLEIQQTVGGTSGIFQLFRGPRSIKIRYRISNQSASDFSIRPTGILIKVNGRSVSFGISRESADKTKPTVLPSGAAETGIINAPVRGPRQVEVIFSLFPVEEDRQGPSRTVPTTFQLIFAGLARLPVSPAP